jgi:hypothetical protein
MSTSIVPEVSQNGKHPDKTASFEIQVNRHVQFGNGVTKTGLKRKLNKENKNVIENWETISTDILGLKSILEQGYTIRAAIKIGGNEKVHVRRLDVLLLDFDESLVKDTLANPLSTYASFWYHTPSYVKGENEKHRLGFILDRTATPDEGEKLNSYLKSKYPSADKISEAALFFGSFPGGVTIISEDIRLPLDAFLGMEILPEEEESIDDFGQGALPNIPKTDTPASKDGVRTQALKWINKEIFIGACGGDVNRLYCLHNHALKPQRHKTHIGNWHGSRPEGVPTGTGFHVYQCTPELPPIFDNQGNTNFKEKANTIIEYWWYYSNYIFDKKWGSILWEKNRKYENFKIVCDDIAKHFDVKPFPLEEILATKKKKDTGDILKQVETVLQTYVYMLKAGAKDSYLYWDFSAGVWRVKPDATQVFRDCIKYSMKNHHGVDSDILDNPKIASLIESHIKRYDGYKSFNDKIDFDVKRCADVVPLANGDWNWRTKIFTESFDHTNYNMTRSPLDFTPLKPSLTHGAALLMRWMDDIGYSENQKRGVRSWLIVNCLGIATRTKRMLNVFGTPETGKTVIGQVVQNCLGSLGMTLNGNSFTDAGNRFANQSLDGAYGLFIDEFRTDARGWEMLKQLTGNADLTINVEKKGLSDYKAKFYAGITTATQDKFFIPNSDDGGIRRRVALLKHTPEMHKPHLKNIDMEFSKPCISQDIFNWCIQQDGEKAVSDFIDFAESDESKSALQETVLSSDKTLQFMADCIVFTDDEKDVVSNLDIQTCYEVWLSTTAGEHISDKVRASFVKITQYIREKVSIKDNGFIWKLCPEKGKESKVSIGGKQVRGLRGLKLKKIDSDYPI